MDVSGVYLKTNLQLGGTILWGMDTEKLLNEATEKFARYCEMLM